MLHREGIYFAVLKTIRFSNKEPPVRFIAWPLEVFCDNIVMNIPVSKMHLSGHVGSNVPVDGKHHWNSLIAMHIL